MASAVLVAGGAGNVGSHACKALAQAGFLPIALDNLSTGHEAFVRWGPLVRAELHDTAAVANTIRRHDCAAGCDALVFSSTCAIYGQPAQVPIREEALPDPINPYGASKLMVECVLADFRPAFGLRSIALRYFNACGADPDGEVGELRDPETHLIPRAMMALQGHIGDFAVFGRDFPTPDGTAIRDYIHVTDLAEAHVAALQLLLAGGAGGVFNLGTGRGYSVKQVLQAIEREAGERLPGVMGPRRSGARSAGAGVCAEPLGSGDDLAHRLGVAPAGASEAECSEPPCWTACCGR